jgi:hypothetical protein
MPLVNSFFKKRTLSLRNSARDLLELVKREILLKKGRTGKGVYYTLNPVYRGHNGTYII